MCENYNYEYNEKMKLVIAGKLHDIGKLAIPIEILDKPKKLDDEGYFNLGICFLIPYSMCNSILATEV
jgi:response regulator RpfG family c-di-GMP phosphodiesterase